MKTKLMPRLTIISSFALLTFLLFFSIYLYNPQPLLAANLSPTQTYYVPLPEAQISTAFTNLTTFPNGATCTEAPSAEPLTTYLSIVPVADDAIIYYDHWEDGFDRDIANPAPSSSTEIWGDGDTTNGFLTAYPSDTFSAGQVIVLTSVVDTTIMGALGFDGGDKVATNKAMAMSRTSWAAQTATRLAGAVEMYDTRHWGTSYHIPVGEDLLNGGGLPEPFEYTALSVMAAQDNTQVYFNSILETTLAEGQSYFIDGTIQSNDMVTATAPVQVDLITGDLCAAFESRWYALFPDELLSNSYYTPVGTVTTTAPAEVYLYNPNRISIVVRRVLVDGTTNLITVPAGQTILSTLPNNVPNSGASFASTDGSPFSAISNMWGPNYDWGFTLIPEELLTPGVTVGFGPGQDPTMTPITATNGSPIWVTPIIPPGGPPTVTLVIDYEHDGSRVDRVDLSHLENYRVFDPVDNDQTGILLYIDTPFLTGSSYVKLAAVWGQDPTSSPADSPGLDMGTALVPAPLFVGQAQTALAIDSDSNGEINPGDTLTYTIVIQNVSVLPISDIVISDTVPLYTTYIPGSVHLTGSGTITDTLINTGTVGSTLFPLDEGGYTIATLLGNETVTVTFVVTANVLPEGITELVHVPTIGFLDQMFNPSNSIPITATPNFEIEILVDGENPDSSGVHYIVANEPITWTYIVTNTGHVPLTMTNFISSTTPISVTGDSNGDGIFDPGEIWIYTEVVIPSSTAPNGSSLSSSMIRGERGDTLITQTQTSMFFAANLFLQVDKIASVDTITTTTDVTYTYLITNSGNITITPFITDDLCSPLTLVAATDLLSDTLLSINETWHYQCNMPVSTDLMNTVTVTGTGPADLIVTPITDTAFVDYLPSIQLQKAVTPTVRAEPGGLFTYTLTLTNTTPETVTVTVFTDTHPLSAACQLAWVGSQLASGAATSCIYSVTHSVPGIYTNTITVTAQDDEGNPVSATDHAVAQVMDELPAITLTKIVTPVLRTEPGGLFTYTLTITNTASETATLTVFTDTHPLSAACQLAWVGSQLSGGATDSCTYSVTHSAAGTYTNTASVTAQDDEGNQSTADAHATAQVGNEPPAVSLTKLVIPTQVMEPGGIFTYTLSLTNLAVEAVTVITLTDSHTLSAGCQALIGSVLAVGETVTCGYQVTHTGISSYTNQALVVVVDDEGMQGNDSAETTVHVLDEIPTVVLTKMVTPTTLPAPGGTFTYTLVITNTSVRETVNLIELHDTFPVSAECRALVRTTLGPGLVTSCSYTVEHLGIGIHENNATVVVTDDEDNRVEEDNTDDEIPPVEIVPTVFIVEKRPSVDRVAEPGEMVTFTVSITNIGSETITLVALVDDIYGNLSGRGSCVMGQTMVAGENYSCVFSAFVEGLAGSVHANTVTATALNQDNDFFQASGNAAITIDDVLPEILVTKIADPGWLPEPGGFVTFTVSIENRSTEVVTMTTLVDSIYGDLNGLGNCTVPQVLPIGQTYHCAWDIEFVGDPGFSEVDTVTATAHDRTGNVAEDSDDATVLIIDVNSALEVTKSANREQVSEPGEPVTFHLVISNTSGADTIVLDSILDSIYGDLTNLNNAALLATDCTVGEMLAVDESTECFFTAMVSGQPGNVHTNRVTTIGTDNDGTTVTDNGPLVIDIIDVPPAVSIFKRANVESVPPPGANVTFAITIANQSLVDSILVTTLTDTIFGDLTALANSTCTVPQILAVDTSYRCEFVGFVGGADGDSHTNTATAAIIDDDGVSLEVSDSEVVAILGVTEIVVNKEASRDRVPESGEVISFTVTVSNTGSSGNVTLTTLNDSIYGDLTQISDSTCMLPQELAMGTQYSCLFVGPVMGSPGDVHENVVIVDAVDRISETMQVSATAAVDIYDVLSFISVRKSASPSQVPEQGAMVDFAITVKNESLADAVTLDSLIDDIYGDLSVYSDGNCQVPQTLQPNGSYTCTITAFVDGGANTLYQDTVAASAVDDDGRSIFARGTVIVEIIDTPGEIQVQMGADKDVVSESGETVRFMVAVQNISPSDVVTLTSMIDSIYGDLTAYPDSTCTMPQVLGVGQQYNCEFPALISLATGGSNIQTNIATVSAQDDDRRLVNIEGADEHRIVIADPKISARKTDNHIDASQDGLVSPGDIIDYTIVVENSGIVTATGVTVEDILDDHSTFGGILMSTQGMINQIDTRSVLVEVGEIAPSQQITILLGTAITDAGITASQLSCIENQAGIRGLNILPLFTDDPDSAMPEDATGTNCDPTTITLAYFAPIWQADGAYIHWVTGAEFNTWGFHIWRAMDKYVGNATRITDSMILAGVPGDLYSVVDTQANHSTDYYYWLEETEIDGRTTMHGPFLLEPDPEIRSTGNVDELVEKHFLPVVWR